LAVVLAVYALGGAQRFVDTEDVGKKAAELAPGRFAWRKYPDQINLELVRVALSDAKKAEHGHLLDGSGRKGWTLTPAGLKWANKNSPQLLSADLKQSGSAQRSGSVDSARMDRESARLRKTHAWSNWPNNLSSISVDDAKEVFRIDAYARGAMLSLKINRLRNLFAADKDMDSFLEAMSSLAVREDKRDG